MLEQIIYTAIIIAVVFTYLDAIQVIPITTEWLAFPLAIVWFWSIVISITGLLWIIWSP